MKKIICIAILVCIVNVGLQAQGYVKKQTKKELRSYLKDPERYYNEKNTTNERLIALEREMNNYKKKAETFQTALEEKDEMIADLKAENAKFKAAPCIGLGQSRGAKPGANGSEASTSFQYRVQIGVYSKFSINQFLSSAKCIMTSQVNGNNVYDVAGFNDLNEASMMTQELKRMGLKDAFVTKYVNGSRDYSFDATRMTGVGRSSTPSSFSAIPASSPSSESPSVNKTKSGSLMIVE